jgi:hypothetical protein
VHGVGLASMDEDTNGIKVHYSTKRCLLQRPTRSNHQTATPRVRKNGGNRSDSTGSRWNRSGPVHELVWFPPQNRAYKFASTANRPVSLVNRPGFSFHRNRSSGGLVNPGYASPLVGSIPLVVRPSIRGRNPHGAPVPVRRGWLPPWRHTHVSWSPVLPQHSRTAAAPNGHQGADPPLVADIAGAGGGGARARAPARGRKGRVVALPQDHGGDVSSWRENSLLQEQDAAAARVTSHNVRDGVLTVDEGAIV